MRAEKQLDYIPDFITYLNGGKKSIEITDESVHDAAKCIAYILQKSKYHRVNTVTAITELFMKKFSDEKSTTLARSYAWELLQQVPLSHLTELPKILKKKYKKTPKRIRNALIYKIVHSREEEILRAFMIASNKYRAFFTYMKLPKSVIKEKIFIKNRKYLFAVRLYTNNVTLKDLIPKYGLKYIIRRLGIQVERILEFITVINEIEEIASIIPGNNFFEHGEWFKKKLGDELYTKYTKQHVKTVKDPLNFLRIKEHLEEKGIMPPSLIESMEERSRELLAEMQEKAGIKSLALIVDNSGSMEKSVSLTIKLYEPFSYFSNITDLIHFNYSASNISLEELKLLTCGGGTSIGSSLVTLYKNIKKRKKLNVPEAIILVSDLDENTAPMFSNGIELLRKNNLEIPIIILQVPYYYSNQFHTVNYSKLNYPIAIVKVTEFHVRLIPTIMENFIKLTAKLVKEKEDTKILGVRSLVTEDVNAINLKLRDPKTLQENYFTNLLNDIYSEEKFAANIFCNKCGKLLNEEHSVSGDCIKEEKELSNS